MILVLHSNGGIQFLKEVPTPVNTFLGTDELDHLMKTLEGRLLMLLGVGTVQGNGGSWKLMVLGLINHISSHLMDQVMVHDVCDATRLVKTI